MKMNDQKITIFYTRVTKKFKMFKAPTLPPAKKRSCNKSTFYLSLERYENKDIDVLGDVGESKRETS